MGRKGRTGPIARLGTRIPFLAAISALALAAPATAGAATPALAASGTTVTATSAATTTARTVTLVTGDRVTLTSSHGGTSALLTPAAGSGPAQTYRNAGGDEYVIPAIAAPYIGRQLDPSLFDVSALLRQNLTSGAHIPVSVTYAAGVTPSAPPGITLTSVGGQSASGYLTAASTASFNAGLRASIGADIKAGHPAGIGALFGGVTDVSLTGSTVVGAVSAHSVLHDVSISETDTSGNPLAAGSVELQNLDDLQSQSADVPVDDGVGKVALPAGRYIATSLVFDFNAGGENTAVHWITDDDVTIPSSGTVPTVKLSEAQATSAITVSTPRPSTEQSLSATIYTVDSLGEISSDALIGISSAPLYISPTAKPPVGAVRLQASWSGVGPTAGPAYRYDTSFSTTDIPADEAYVVRSSQLATVNQSYDADPAEGSNGVLFNSAFDANVNAELAEGGGFFTAGVTQTMPTTVTDYIGTADSGEWGQQVLTANETYIGTDERTFTSGENTSISWLHGPLQPTIGQHSGTDVYCEACTAGSSLLLAYGQVGDTQPDHEGSYFGQTTQDFTFYRNGALVYDGAGDGIEATGINTAPSTYQAIYSTDASGVTGISQSTAATTDVTVSSADTVALPSGVSCYGQSGTAPCRLLPVLMLNYQLNTDGYNTSNQPIELLQLGVSHVGYDGVESHAAITSAAVSVSFDGGTTWQQATVDGSNGQYFAAWDNPTSAQGTSPEIKVTATDAVGGSITQTIADAYTIAK